MLRDPVESRRAVEGAVAAASLAALGRAASTPHLPLISQAQMLSDIATAEGAAPPKAARASLEAVAPPLALSLATSAVVGQSLGASRCVTGCSTRSPPGSRRSASRCSIAASPHASRSVGPLRPVRVLGSQPNQPASMEVDGADTELAEELLQIEEADAWFEYLESTRSQGESRYSELEPWAWARLTSGGVPSGHAVPVCGRGGLSAPSVSGVAEPLIA